jgi:hypothetical protein
VVIAAALHPATIITITTVIVSGLMLWGKLSGRMNGLMSHK